MKEGTGMLRGSFKAYCLYITHNVTELPEFSSSLVVQAELESWKKHVQHCSMYDIQLTLYANKKALLCKPRPHLRNCAYDII